MPLGPYPKDMHAKNALHNLSKKVIASEIHSLEFANLNALRESDIRYGKGVLVGFVAGLMYSGKSFEQAIAIAKDNLPNDFEPQCMPEGW